MNISKIKTALPIGLLGTTVAVMAVFGNGQPSLSRAMEATAWFDRPAASLTTAASAYAAGSLLEGHNHFVYYVTGAGTRQPIYDHDTLTAFGWQEQPVIRVKDEILSSVPVADPLTRLVEDEQGNLYWAAQGQLWQVNEWWSAIESRIYEGLPVSRLDSSLAETLPVRPGLPNGAYLRQGEQLYYFINQSLIPAPAGSETMEAIDIPAEALALYPQLEAMDRLYTRLNADTYLANIRRGPGIEYEIMGTVSNQEEIVVTGRAANSYWLRVTWQEQTGWLAGDLIKDEAFITLLPAVNPDETISLAATVTPAPQQAGQTTTAATGLAEIGVQLVRNDTWPEVAGLWAGQPAEQAGLKIGDLLTDLNGQSLSYASASEAARQLRGEAGSAVTLRVYRPSTGQWLDFSLNRAVFNPAAATLLCGEDPIRGFGTVWRNHPEVRPLLGCTFTNFRQDEHATRAAVQTFEHGWMLWLETDTVLNVDPIYVFFEDDGSYVRYGDQPLTDAHKYAPTDPGFFKVGDRFAKVYGEYLGPQGRARLGRATDEARDNKGAFQEFVNGRMFWAGESDTIYIIYRGYYDFDRDGETTWEQGWTSFEDKFEEVGSK
ncbi:MAG TPA: PDZ domain-containing protein [Anaerolineae bacterium]|nr:PDZ domain-containing protein [Anaerolineae bacterium]